MSPTKKKWNERDTMKFLELYEGEEVLWNVKRKDHKIKDARNAAIERIIHSMNMNGLTIQDINCKINNIRSTYAQERVKIRNSAGTGSGSDEIYIPSLVWFEIADRFLSGVIKSKKTHQNVESNKCASDMPTKPSDIPVSPLQDVPPIASPDIPANPSPDIPANPSDVKNNTQSVSPSSRKKIKKTLPQHITKTIKTLESIRNQAMNSKETEDEFHHFGKNVASQLRQLPLLDALDVQSDILNLIKRKRQLIQQFPSNGYDTIEIPKSIITPQQNILNHEETIVPESNSELENEVQDSKNNLKAAIRSMGGKPEE